MSEHHDASLDAVEATAVDVTAARWWAEQATSSYRFDNGYDDQADFVTGMCAFQDDVNGSDADIDGFVTELAAVIALARIEGDGILDIKVDYHAPAIMVELAGRYGFGRGSMMTFPPKTTMTIIDDEIHVRAGHGAETVTLPVK